MTERDNGYMCQYCTDLDCLDYVGKWIVMRNLSGDKQQARQESQISNENGHQLEAPKVIERLAVCSPLYKQLQFGHLE